MSAKAKANTLMDKIDTTEKRAVNQKASKKEVS